MALTVATLAASAFSIGSHASLSSIHRPVSTYKSKPSRMGPPPDFPPAPPPRQGDYVDIICRQLNYLVEQTVVGSVRAYAQPRTATKQGDFWATIKSPPELPGLSRPVWLTISASVPTALGWCVLTRRPWMVRLRNGVTCTTPAVF